MKLDSITSHQRSSWYSHSHSSTIKSDTHSTEAKESNQVRSSSPEDSSRIWEKLSSNYNVRKATFEDIVDIANSLYESDEISLKNVASLTFKPTFSLYETETNVSGQRDWIEEFKQRASKNFSHGNLIGYESNMNVLSILQKLER